MNYFNNLFNYKSRLAKRLAINVILASTFITIFTSAYQLFEIYKTDVKQIEFRLNDIQTGQSNSIAALIWVIDKEELNRNLQSLLSLPDIEYIKLTLDTNETIEVGEIPIEENIEKKFPLNYTFNTQKHPVGQMHIIASLEDTYQRLIGQAISIIASNAIKTFIISGFLLLLFHHLVIKHLIKIAEHARGINHNPLKEKLILERSVKPSHQKDEFDNLVNAFNEMKVNLSDSILQLSTSKKYLSQIINAINDAVITITESGTIISMNKMAESLFGYHQDEMIGQNIKKLMLTEQADHHENNLLKICQIGKSNIPGEYIEAEGQNKDHEVIPLRISVAELPSDESGELRFIGIIHDLSEMKAKEEQLVQSQKMEVLGKLTGGISHDFNNLLGIIVGYSDLLKMKLSNQPELLRQVEQISTAGERGSILTKKLLSFSSKQALEAQRTDINKLIISQLDMLQKVLTVRIQLIYEQKDDVWPVFLDSYQLADCILNLAINGMHAMDDDTSEQKPISKSGE